ncbi:MAG: DUF4358 domain-containing protein [Clostridia bacterium]|nr:DUF4358 domain-containing protein [Clostridia bacterium]
MNLKWTNRWWMMLILLLAVMMTASACSSGTYRNDVSAQTLTETMIDVLSEEDGQYYTASGDAYAVYFDADEAYDTVQDCCIAYHITSINVDQFGVFRVKNGQSTESVRTMVQKYVDDQVEYLNAFAANYNQDELAKIENARVEVVGQYVCFTILTASDEGVAIDALKAAISKD